MTTVLIYKISHCRTYYDPLEFANFESRLCNNEKVLENDPAFKRGNLKLGKYLYTNIVNQLILLYHHHELAFWNITF